MCLPIWAHWRHLTNTLELVLPLANPSPQSKLQIDQFACSCTARGRKSLYLQWALLAPKLPFPMRVSGPHLIYGSSGPPESSNQTASRSVLPTLHRRPQHVPILYNSTPFPTQNCLFPSGIWTRSNTWFPGPTCR